MNAAEQLAAARRVRGHSQRTIELDVWVLSAIGKPPQDATSADLERVILRSRSQSGRATYARRIRSIYALLREVGAIAADCRPDDALPRLRAPRGRPRPFTREQVHRLRTEARAPLDDVFLVASLTGLRAMELQRLEGRDLVDGIHGPELEIRQGKGGKDAAIPAHPRVVEVITAAGTLGRIWPQWGSARALSMAASREIKSILGAGTLHQLRHSYATQLLEATSDVALVSKLMRHESIASTQVYALVASSKQRQAIDLLAG